MIKVNSKVKATQRAIDDSIACGENPEIFINAIQNEVGVVSNVNGSEISVMYPSLNETIFFDEEELIIL